MQSEPSEEADSRGSYRSQCSSRPADHSGFASNRFFWMRQLWDTHFVSNCFLNGFLPQQRSSDCQRGLRGAVHGCRRSLNMPRRDDWSLSSQDRWTSLLLRWTLGELGKVCSSPSTDEQESWERARVTRWDHARAGHYRPRIRSSLNPQHSALTLRFIPTRLAVSPFYSYAVNA